MSALYWLPKMVNIGVTGIVMSGDKFLLIQRADLKYWAFPGGGLDSGETLTEGLRREVLEETGLIVEPVRLSGVYMRNRWRSHLVFVFVCKQLEGSARVTDESISVGWFDRAEVAAKLSDHPNLLERFNDAVANNPGAVVRWQNSALPRLIWHWLKQDLQNFFRRLSD